MTKLTIAVPAYNASEYLKENLSKIVCELRCEAYAANDIEILISDNCSTDDTKEVVTSFVELLRSEKQINVNYYRNLTNLGLDRNVENCIKKANGDFVHILCDDDYYTDGSIKRILQVINEHKDLDFILLSNNYLNVFSNKIMHNKGFEQDVETLGVGEFVEKSELKELCLSNCIFKTSKFKNCNIEKYIGKQWPHIALILMSMDKNFKTYIFSFSKPVVTVRFGNQRWAVDGGAISFFYNVLVLYKNLVKIGYNKEFELIKMKFLEHIIDARKMKYDNFLLNLKYAFYMFFLYCGFSCNYCSFEKYKDFAKNLLFEKRQEFAKE